MLGARSVYAARSGYHGAVDILPCRASVLAARARAKGSFADIVLRSPRKRGEGGYAKREGEGQSAAWEEWEIPREAPWRNLEGWVFAAGPEPGVGPNATEAEIRKKIEN